MYARRRHVHFAMTGAGVGLFVLAGGVVRLWSVPAAVGMRLLAMVIPPVAAMGRQPAGAGGPVVGRPVRRSGVRRVVGRAGRQEAAPVERAAQ